MSKTPKPDGRICLIIRGDSREKLLTFENSIDLIVTSPPYADARKKHYDSIHPNDFSDWLATFHDVFWNALKPDGSLVINIKDKIVDGVRSHFVWKTIEKLEAKGWQCIDDYIWCKTNPMPGFWPTRLRDGWEYCFHLAKTKRPYMNQDTVRVPIGDWVASRLQKLGAGDLQRHNSVNDSGFGRDISRWVGQKTVLPSNVLNIALVGKNKGHPAVFPVDLPAFFIKLLSRPDGLVADPFAGSGTTAIAALLHGRDCVLIDNNPEYCNISYQRVLKEKPAKKCRIVYEEQSVDFIDKKYATLSSQMSLDLHERHSVFTGDSVVKQSNRQKGDMMRKPEGIALCPPK